MKPKFGITLFALIEILIGSTTLIAVLFSLLRGNSLKPLAVTLFVLITAFTSTAIGLGILMRNLGCYYLLLYFSSMIILSKILLFAGIITLSGDLETTIPASLKNGGSIFYHSLLIYFFTRRSVRKFFGERRSILKINFGDKA